MLTIDKFLSILIIVTLLFLFKLMREKNIILENKGVWSMYNNSDYYNNHSSQLFYCDYFNIFGNKYITLNKKEVLMLEFKKRNYHNYQVYLISNDKILKEYQNPEKLFFIDEDLLNLDINIKNEIDVLYSEKKYMILLRVNNFDLIKIIPNYNIIKFNYNKQNLNNVYDKNNIMIDENDLNSKFEKQINSYIDELEEEGVDIKDEYQSSNTSIYPLSNNTIMRQVKLNVKRNNSFSIFSINRTVNNCYQNINVQVLLPQKNINNFNEKDEYETVSLEIPDKNDLYFNFTIDNDFDTIEEEYIITEIIYNINKNSILMPFKVFLIDRHIDIVEDTTL